MKNEGKEKKIPISVTLRPEIVTLINEINNKHGINKNRIIENAVSMVYMKDPEDFGKGLKSPTEWI